ncbi:hypothetical protein SAMN05446037_101872 [Anaerovirgula multivorans]|uniref:AB hydrolase-1 domain-containing protein n=1 Tax=Anaerovirgula multivorans TaxID=312168 RepID=A0A239GVQ5_9FIRM|nr:alpha/beta fold hydrolase [Anaerovirgula multivorans]SNS72134.1 hypothetical protein SAMN05446037_101872 [Anaerovirgula multivorans]
MNKFNVTTRKLEQKEVLKIIKRIVIVSIGVYIFLLLFTHFFLERIILWPRKLSQEVPSLSIQQGCIENIELKMKDGTIIRGWFIKKIKSEKMNLLIYFGANAEELSSVISKMANIDEWSVALINYRGYGMSEGSATETTLYSDSEEIYDYFINREDINKSNIVVMGRSIGTGVATYLAEKRKISAVILVSPYDNLPNLVQNKCLIVPANLILPHKYDSIGRAPSIEQPLLILTGSEDGLIPIGHSKRLKEAWGGKVFYEELFGESHNSIDDVEEYWNKIEKFLFEQESL